MTSKRELVALLKSHKKQQQPLTAKQCDELIDLIGGNVRPNHRPRNKYQLREGTWTSHAELVFGFLNNAESLRRLEKELEELNQPVKLEEVLPNLAMTDPIAARQLIAEHVSKERLYLEKMISSLRTRSAKNRSDAIRMAVAWYAKRGVKLESKKLKNGIVTGPRAIDEKYIANQLDDLKERAGLRRLGLVEWKKIKSDYEKKMIHKKTT